MRKLVILLLCALVAFGVYGTIAIGFSFGENLSVYNYEKVSDASRSIDTLISELTNVNNVQYEQKKTSLTSAIKKYKDVKEEYDELLETAQTNNNEEEVEISLVDIYDVDFLWTTIGNYGTEEGIGLKFDVVKSSNSNLTSQNYTMCDLKFSITGEYIPITDFIYDLEDDNKLGFEISEFSIQKGGDKLQATFTVKSVPINNKNLSDLSNSSSNNNAMVDENGNPQGADGTSYDSGSTTNRSQNNMNSDSMSSGSMGSDGMGSDGMSSDEM